MRTCRCGYSGPEFYKSRSASDGLCTLCKTCQKKANDANAEKRRRSKLKSKYGMSPEKWDEMFDAQGGVCAICHRPETIPGKRLAVDHDHRCCPGRTSCGKCVRKLLCHFCNVGIGHLGDSPEILRRAADYIEGSDNSF